MRRLLSRLPRRLHLTGLAMSLLFSAPLPAEPSNAIAVEEITLEQLERAYRSGKVTVRDVVQAHLARIAALDPQLGAIITVNPDALAEAEALDASFRETGNLAGPLHGVPVLVKDNFDVAGLPTTGGSMALIGWKPTKDSTAVAKLRAAGAIVIAKTTMSEWARGAADNLNSVIPGFARNPYNLPYATGGSSGGTASGLAASFGVVGLGSDTFGSIRLPAANTAVVGLRPSWALVSRAGMIGLYGARDTAGPMARTVTDVAKLLDVIAGVDPADPATANANGHVPKTYTAALTPDSLRGKRLGVLRAAFPTDQSDAEVAALFERALNDLRAQGAEIIDPFVIPGFAQFPPQQHPQSEMRAAIERYLATTGPGFPKTIAEIVAARKFHPFHEVGLLVSSKAPAPADDPIVTKLAETEAAMREAYMKAMDQAGIDALVLPINSHPPKINGDRLPPSGPTTGIASALHWPAISVPMGYTHAHLPSGLQFIGRPWSEPTLLALAYGYEQATHHRVPPRNAPPLPDTLKDRFVGVWNLQSVHRRDPATGAKTPLGASGHLHYAASGHLAMQVDADPPSEPHAAGAQEFPLTVTFGRWRLLPGENGVEHLAADQPKGRRAVSPNRYAYEFDTEGRLILTVPGLGSDATSSDAQWRLVWEKCP